MHTSQDEINRLDAQLLKLLDRRALMVEWMLSNADSQSVCGGIASAAKQIERVISKYDDQNSSIDDASRREVLQHVASVCLASVQELRVAFLGPKYSYSHLASLKYFGEGADFAPVGSIAGVFEAVLRGDVAAGLVPIENSTDGRVVDTLGMFVRQKLPICGEVVLPIHHNLLSRSPREAITEIHSKPQALSQCRQWLSIHFPSVSIVESGSTTAAAELAASECGIAAVASLEAGRQYKLDVIAANIEDNPNNVTRFAVLGKDLPAPTGDDKTSLLFQVNHQPGALADVMTIFKHHELNLTWIESFPSSETPNEYHFFIELTGHRDEKNVAAAFAELYKQTQQLEILGSYPRGR
ncbi:prephenate dehydratase [Novipirellula aureliae]|nr:prephenate dehydratase [Novipirellula aureliae]